MHVMNDRLNAPFSSGQSSRTCTASATCTCNEKSFNRCDLLRNKADENETDDVDRVTDDVDHVCSLLARSMRVAVNALYIFRI
jgi:hypothetical protein